MSTETTTRVILEAAEVFEMKALELRRMAKELTATGDWNIAGEAVACCASACTNIRLDLLVIRPVRELTRKIESANNQ